MSDYIPTTEEIRQEFHDAFESNSLPLEFSSAFILNKFDRWLKRIQAKAWAEGFDAGEQDVWEHQHGETGEDWDKECIANPYLEGDSK